MFEYPVCRITIANFDCLSKHCQREEKETGKEQFYGEIHQLFLVIILVYNLQIFVLNLLPDQSP
jgi:hypothetical protein